MKLLSRVRLFETPWTAAYQVPPSMGFSRQEYWSGVPLPSPGSRSEDPTYLMAKKPKHKTSSIVTNGPLKKWSTFKKKSL